VNSWDLVDLSAPNIVGEWLSDKDKDAIYVLARSGNIWKRRVAIVSTFAFIKNNDLHDVFAISAMLLDDREDLIHKAVGWMLREAGKRNEKALLDFLEDHSRSMPRTALRYAIERLDEKRRKKILISSKK
jgi:3-methyladenine DNA glycosylase AlkD